MVDLVPPSTILTPASAANDFQANGLEALGLTAPQLSGRWAGSNPSAADYDPASLSIRLSDPCAPFIGIASWLADPAVYSGITGAALAGPALAFELHPEAVRRLQVIVDGGAASRVLNVPRAMLLREATPLTTLPPTQIYLPGETLHTGTARVTFHDSRGLMIDPIALAHLWNALLAFRPGLRSTTLMTAPGDPGGVASMLGFAAGDLCHVIDPHGWTFRAPRATSQMCVLNAGGDRLRDVPASGLVELAAGETLGRPATEPATLPLRWGFARNGVLGRGALTLPPVPAGFALGRRFLRVMAVDLDWHLLGNRSASIMSVVAGGDVPADDGATPNFLLPQVRDGLQGFTWLADGAAVLGAAGAALTGFGNAGDQLMAVAVSPAIDSLVTLLPAAGAAGRWPAFPPLVSPPGEIVGAADPRRGAFARWRAPADGAGAGRDVVLTLDGAQLPPEAHVRAYSRQFAEIRAISEQPSFVRGDGGAAIARGGPVRLLLLNPFGLAPAEPRPAQPMLSYDLVVVSRSGRRRIYSSNRMAVETGPDESFAADTGFGGIAALAAGSLFSSVLDGFMTRGIAPSSLFGLPTPPPSAGPPTSLTDLVRRLASDEQPRQAPRLPTQARFDTEFVVGVGPGGGGYVLQAVVTGARLTPESRHTQPELANAGHPSGPDVFAAGVLCDGLLARDVAIHALKRAQPIFIPTGGASFRGWLATLMDNKWWQGAPPPNGLVAAAMLETIAAHCDTPELSLAPAPQPGASVQGLLNTIANALGVPPPTGTIGNEANVIPLIQREIVTARSGQRDALWSLTRALNEARELIYIEGPAFARTARPAGPPLPGVIDLVATIAFRMAGNPRLKVIICCPREGDFARDRPHWSVTALANRREAIQDLIGVDPARVAAFHPIGFPGRHAMIRTTTVIVDDVYGMTGTSHFRRRGMTFDGGLDIASFDRTIAEGYSFGLADFRRRLMAAKLGVMEAAAVPDATALWVRLGSPESAFDAVRDLLAGGGGGRLEPIWNGPTADGLISQPDDVVDPDGLNDSAFLGLFGSLLLEG